MAHCCRGVSCRSLRLGVEGLRGCWEGGSALFRRNPLSPQTLLGITLDRGWRPGRKLVFFMRIRSETVGICALSRAAER